MADPERRMIYGASLSQFDELMASAAQASPRSRPLPLFYALSQGGRAIAAALADEPWKLRGHGLSAPVLFRNDPCEVEIKPSPSTKEKTVDSFGGAASMTRSGPLVGPVSIGELWSSLPGVCELLEGERWPRPLLVHADDTDMNSPLFDFKSLSATLEGARGDAAEAVKAELARYAGAEGAMVISSSRRQAFVAWPNETADVPGWRATLERVAPVDALIGQRWMRPDVGGSALNPLMTWWALLFGLSMLARYEPGVWVSALDLDRPGRAAQLAELMDQALQAIPILILDAISLAEDEPHVA
jgi:hypothetical protein